MKKRNLFYSFSLFVAFTMSIAWQFAAQELDERDPQADNAVTDVVISEKE